MTNDEAATWYEKLTEPQRIQILVEHHELKQRLCSQTLLVPTGAEDWINRAVLSAERLRECERQFRKIVNVVSETIEDAVWRTKFRECTNCMGQKTVGNASCICCDGTGVRQI